MLSVRRHSRSPLMRATIKRRRCFAILLLLLGNGLPWAKIHAACAGPTRERLLEVEVLACEDPQARVLAAVESHTRQREDTRRAMGYQTPAATDAQIAAAAEKVLRYKEVILKVRQLRVLQLPPKWKDRRRLKGNWEPSTTISPIEMVLFPHPSGCDSLRSEKHFVALEHFTCCDTYPAGSVACLLGLPAIQQPPPKPILPP